ncbi:hypothetical protein TSMEX_002459 [Taenia solium]|eukprot:TsM_000120500 transcript=TsM_000120500 gene=TsM_000120500
MDTFIREGWQLCKADVASFEVAGAKTNRRGGNTPGGRGAKKGRIASGGVVNRPDAQYISSIIRRQNISFTNAIAATCCSRRTHKAQKSNACSKNRRRTKTVECSDWADYMEKFTVSPDPRSAFEQPAHLSTPNSHVHIISGSSVGISGEKAVHPSTFSYTCSTDQMAVMDAGGSETNPFLTASSMMMSASQLARYTSMYPNDVYETLGDLMFPRALSGSSTAATSGGTGEVPTGEMCRGQLTSLLILQRGNPTGDLRTVIHPASMTSLAFSQTGEDCFANRLHGDARDDEKTALYLQGLNSQPHEYAMHWGEMNRMQSSYQLMYEATQMEEQGSVLSSVGSTAASHDDSPQTKTDGSVSLYPGALEPENFQIGGYRYVYGEVAPPPPLPLPPASNMGGSDFYHLSHVYRHLPVQLGYTQANGGKPLTHITTTTVATDDINVNTVQASVKAAPPDIFQFNGSCRKCKS